MKNEEVTAIIANLCTNFEVMVQRIKAASKKHRLLEEQIESLENKEIAEQKEHDRQIDQLARDLEAKRADSQQQSTHQQRTREETGSDRQLQAEIDDLKRKIKELEVEGSHRQSSLRQTHQKLSEEDKSLQALIQARDKLEREQQAVDARIAQLEAELGPGSKRQSICFEQTKDIISLREGKAELQKLQAEERLRASAAGWPRCDSCTRRSPGAPRTSGRPRRGSARSTSTA